MQAAGGIRSGISSEGSKLETRVSVGDYFNRDHVLEQLRRDIYLSGTYVRDLLLEQDPNNIWSPPNEAAA